MCLEVSNLKSKLIVLLICCCLLFLKKSFSEKCCSDLTLKLFEKAKIIKKHFD